MVKEATMSSAYKCAITGCERPKSQNGKNMITFPTNPARKNLWLQSTGKLSSTSNEEICDGHFKASDFYHVTIRKRILKHDSVPSLHLPASCWPKNEIMKVSPDLGDLNYNEETSSNGDGKKEKLIKLWTNG